MKKSEWERVFRDAITELRKQKFVPYDTGNLKLNAIKGEWINNTTFRRWVDESVAEYMKYTNEDWGKFSPPLAGKTNPHENWWGDACNFVAYYIRDRLGGEIK